jgi:hypothetical protein
MQATWSHSSRRPPMDSGLEGFRGAVSTLAGNFLAWPRVRDYDLYAIHCR